MIWRDNLRVGEYSAGDMKVKQRISTAWADGELKENPIHHDHICLNWAVPDEHFRDARVAWYLDGEEAHKNREAEDNEMREALASMRWLVVECKYRGTLSDRQADRVFEILMAHVHERLGMAPEQRKGSRIELTVSGETVSETQII